MKAFILLVHSTVEQARGQRTLASRWVGLGSGAMQPGADFGRYLRRVGYLEKVDRYMKKLFDVVRPHLYENGGPVISVQVENEYGSYVTCDQVYMQHLVELFRDSLGENVILFTTDPPFQLRCGATNGTFTTVDFGLYNEAGVNFAFTQMRTHNGGKGPLINSEFYPGWYDWWGSDHANKSTEQVLATMDLMWVHNASFNFYMFHGGTNFGFNTAGEATFPKSYTSITTSYDYDAPLSESGDITPKYMAIRGFISEKTHADLPHLPTPSRKLNVGVVPLSPVGSVFDFLSKLRCSEHPETFEDLDVGYGFVLYESTLRGSNKTLSVTGVRDRGYVMVNHELVGVVPVNEHASFDIAESDAKLHILVENMGRIGFGRYLGDRKGMTANLTFGGDVVTDFTFYFVDAGKAAVADTASHLARSSTSLKIPGFFSGSFELSEVADTFLDPTHFEKGQAYVNGFNLGRYWTSAGPQQRLYVPGTYLHTGMNTVTLFELEKASNHTVSFLDTPSL